MFTFNNLRSTTIISSGTDNDIIYAIVTGDINKIRKSITSLNIDKIIDSKNNFTALHYSVTSQSNDIIKYLLNCGANPELKSKDGKNIYDFALSYQKKIVFEHFIEKNQDKIDVLKTKVVDRDNKINTLQTTIKFLTQANDEYSIKVNMLNNQISDKNIECSNLKRKLKDAETTVTTLLKKQKK
jgi:ankyrin repeat protein